VDSHGSEVDSWSNGLGARQLPASKDESMESEDIVRIRYQTTTGDDTADWEDLECAVVTC
jgi:hypothetical protein